MLEKFKSLELLERPKKYYLLGLTITNEVEYYNLLEIAIHKSDINVLKRYKTSSFEELIDYLKKDYPIIMHLDGDNVISKSVAYKTGYRNTIVFKTDPDQFYFYEFLEEDTVYVSLTRKIVVDVLLERFNTKDIFITHLAFGPFVLMDLKLLIKNTGSLKSNLYELDLSDDKLLAFTKTNNLDSGYTIGNETININETSALAAFLGYLYPNSKVTYDKDYLSENKDEAFYKGKFKFYGTAALALILLALLITHFVLKYNLDLLIDKQSELSVSQQTLLKLEGLKEEQQLKEAILLSSGIINKNYFTQYLNDIALRVPDEIILTDIGIKAPQKKIRPEEKIVFNTELIAVSGFTKNDDAFNEWIKSLKAIDWVKDLNIYKYIQGTKSENSFELNIRI